MPNITTDDGVKLHYEEAGSGAPVVFVHEFAGDWRSWEPQMRYFSRRYRCITYSARGYLPSDVPKGLEHYSQEHWREDVRAVIDALELDAPHVVGLSMGAFATLHFGMKYCARGSPARARSLTLARRGRRVSGRNSMRKYHIFDQMRYVLGVVEARPARAGRPLPRHDVGTIAPTARETPSTQALVSGNE